MSTHLLLKALVAIISHNQAAAEGDFGYTFGTSAPRCAQRVRKTALSIEQMGVNAGKNEVQRAFSDSPFLTFFQLFKSVFPD
jgi:hypothetical protein